MSYSSKLCPTFRMAIGAHEQLIMTLSKSHDCEDVGPLQLTWHNFLTMSYYTVHQSVGIDKLFGPTYIRFSTHLSLTRCTKRWMCKTVDVPIIHVNIHVIHVIPPFGFIFL
jgi:hypothetical protein